MCAESGGFFCARLNLLSLPEQSHEAVRRLAELWDFPAGFTYRPLLRMPFRSHHSGACTRPRTQIAEETF